MEYLADETESSASFYTFCSGITDLPSVAFGLCARQGDALFSQKICVVYIIVAMLLTLNGLLLVMLDLYNSKELQKNRPLKGFVQVLQVVLFLWELLLSWRC